MYSFLVVPEDIRSYHARYLQVLSGEPIEVATLEMRPLIMYLCACVCECALGFLWWEQL